jgi:hypothetical protein
MGLLCLVAGGAALATGEPLFPSLSAAMTGLLAARSIHEAGVARRR